MDKEDIVVKKPRCKRGTRRNKKTGNCEKVKPRLTIVDVLPSPSTPVPSVNNTNRNLTSAEKTEILKEIFGSDEELDEDTPGELPDFEELKKITKEKIKNLSLLFENYLLYFLFQTYCLFYYNVLHSNDVYKICNLNL